MPVLSPEIAVIRRNFPSAEESIAKPQPSINFSAEKVSIDMRHVDSLLLVSDSKPEKQRRSGTRFPAKAFQCLRITGEVIGKELQSHKATEVGILGLVHHAHAATAKLLDDAVVRDDLADHGSRDGICLSTASQRTRPLEDISCCGAHVISTFTGMSFFTGMVRSDGGSILKSVSEAGIVPVMCFSLP